MLATLCDDTTSLGVWPTIAPLEMWVEVSVTALSSPGSVQEEDVISMAVNQIKKGSNYGMHPHDYAKGGRGPLNFWVNENQCVFYSKRTIKVCMCCD